MALINIQVPDIGDFDEVTVIEILVKPGDTIAPEQSLITVESDKASMEIPSSHGGVVQELKVQLGDKVKQGSLVLVLQGEGAALAPTAASAPAATAPAAAADPVIASAAKQSTSTPAPAASSQPSTPAAPATVAPQRWNVATASIWPDHRNWSTGCTPVSR